MLMVLRREYLYVLSSNFHDKKGLKINQYIFAVQLDWLWRRGTLVTQQQHMFIAKLALVPQLDYGPLKRRPN